jgi:hypothetical protein
VYPNGESSSCDGWVNFQRNVFIEPATAIDEQCPAQAAKKPGDSLWAGDRSFIFFREKIEDKICPHVLE